MTATQNTVMWRVGDVLRAHELTAYKLAAELHGKVNRNSVYAIARGDTERVDRSTLAALLEALHTLTGKSYSVADLLAYEEVDVKATSSSAVVSAKALNQLASLSKDSQQPAFDATTVKKFSVRGSPPALAQPTDMTAVVAELRGKVD